MATKTVQTGRVGNFRDATGADTYIVYNDTKGLRVFGNLNEDTISIDGFSEDYRVAVSGRNVTLTNLDKSASTIGTIRFTVAVAGKVTLQFVDGALDVEQSGTGRSAKITVGGNKVSKSVKLSSSKFQAVVDDENAFDPTTGSSSSSNTFTLTTDTDVKSLSGTFNGTYDGTANGTFGAGDQLTGTGSADVLNLVATDDAAVTLPRAIVSGVETVNIRNVDGDVPGAAQVLSVDASFFEGTTAFNSDRSTDSLTVDNIASGTSVGVRGNGAVTNGASVFNYAAAATSSTLNISNGVTAGAITLTGTGLTSQTINSTGAANTTGALTLAATTTSATVNATTALTLGSLVGAGLTTLTVSGSGAVDLGTAGPATLATLTAGSGGLTYIAGNVAEATSGVADLTFTGGSGADSLSLVNVDADREVAIDLKGGADTLILDDTAVINELTDSVNGGDGDDTIRVTASATLDAQFSDVVTGFETLEASGTATITLAALDEFAPKNFKVTVSDALANNTAVTVSLDGMATGSTVTLDAAAGLVTRDAADDDGVRLNLSLTTDGLADSVTINVADSYEVISDDIENDFETVNVNYTSTTDGTIEVLDFGASTAMNITSTSANLTVGALTVGTDAVIDAINTTKNITISAMTGALDKYLGGSGTDDVTITAGSLISTNTFSGGSGADDVLRVATDDADSNGGILAISGFETLRLTNGAGAGDVSFTADFRNVTGLNTIIATATTAASDDLVLNRLAESLTLTFATGYHQVTTTTQSGTTQKVAFNAAGTVANLTLDSGTTKLTVTSDNGNDTADEAMGVFTDIDGTAWNELVVLGADRLDAGTLENGVTVDASGATGGLTVTLGATATSAIGSSANDTITGGAGNDTITGGAGNDTLSGAAGTDTYVFASTAALNGSDTITMVVADDILNFKNFLSGGSVDQNGGVGTAIVAYTAASNNDVNITNKVVVFDTNDVALDAAGLVAEIQGAANAFSISSGGKAIVITGDASNPGNVANIFFVNDALDGVNGTISATDVVVVGVTSANFDVDTLITTNFAFA